MSPISESPASSPMIALMMGMPIATIVPNAKLRMIVAAMIPMSSLLSVSGEESSDPTLPPTATCMPAFRPGSAASRTAWASLSSRSAAPMSRSTGMKAVVLSFETWAAPSWLKGLVAVTMSGRARRALRESRIACLLAASVTVPDVVWKMTGFEPFCCGGKRAARRSVARWLSVPGSVRLLLVSAPTRPTTTTRPMASTSQPSSTGSRCAAIQRPMPYRREAMAAGDATTAARGRGLAVQERVSRRRYRARAVLVLVLFALLSGVVTAVSPCVLPALPVVLAGAAGGGRARPVGVALGVVGSFVIFTLALTSALDAIGISPTAQRDAAAVVLVLAGLAMVLPGADARVAAALGPVARLGDRLPTRGSGLAGGLVMGVALGLVWTPCAGPILAAVTAATATGRTTGTTVAVLIAYAVGAAIPLTILALGGRAALRRLGPWSARVRQGLGALMVATAAVILLGLDTRLTNAILRDAPGYTDTLQAFERSGAVQSRLGAVNDVPGAPPLVVAARRADPEAAPLPDAGPAPPLQGISAYFNTGGHRLTLAGLRGRVVLLDFWTYSCINCLRTLPSLEALDAAYRGRGLTVVGVHTPEFRFEADPGNVGRAVRDLGIHYPVVLDPHYETWEAYGNRYWPSEYLIDRDGHVRDLKIGEGGAEHTEALVRRMLGLDATGRPVTAAADEAEPAGGPQTPESYLGYTRLQRFASPGELRPGSAAEYRAPRTLAPDHLAYSGRLTVEPERVDAGPGAAIDLSFMARKVYLVLGTAGGRPRAGHVLLDGRPLPARDAGADVGPGGRLMVDGSRLYALVALPGAAARHRLRVDLAPGTRAYAFTFG